MLEGEVIRLASEAGPCLEYPALEENPSNLAGQSVPPRAAT
jgi:hypothetical protein